MSISPVRSIKEPAFDLNNSEAYKIWRDKKISAYPMSLSDLIVEIKDPRNLTGAEHSALLGCIQKANFAIYSSPTAGDDDPNIPLGLGKQFGLSQLDHNWLSDDTGLTSLKIASEGVRTKYIPYSNRPIKWHTDGYYNLQEKQIHALLLHCVASAANGGENQLMDHEIAYILLRDENPKYIEAFMDPQALSIPPRYSGEEIARPNEAGPVFSITAQGELHMRFTLRAHNVNWKDDSITEEALAFLKTQFSSDSDYIFRGRLEPGMGLISSNILHDRSGFEDNNNQHRHLYRARYFDALQTESGKTD